MTVTILVRMTKAGIDTTACDAKVRAQDDLFLHANGRWITDTDIPEDKASFGVFYLLHEEAERAVRDIIVDAQTAPEGSEQRKFGDLYTSFLNEERVESLGVSPLEDLRAAVESVESVDDFLEVLGTVERRGVEGLFRLFVDNDPGNPLRYLVFWEQGGISLPDESYYREEKFSTIRDSYRLHLQKMFECALSGSSLFSHISAEERANNVVTLETEIAAAHWDNVRNRDVNATYNPLSWGELLDMWASPSRADSSPHPLERWRSGFSAPSEVFKEIVVRQPSFIQLISGLLTPERLESWKQWLDWKVIHAAAPYLSASFVEENFDFYARILSGTPAIRARWKRAVSLVESSLGEAVGKIYVEKHFSTTAKSAIDALVQNLIEAYRQSITVRDWMSTETRNRALEKLAKFTPKVGYPVKWKDYSGLTIDPENLFANIQAVQEHELQRELNKIGSPLDRDEWFMTPQTINAYYNPGLNEIVFPAAILQPPFFDETRDAAANYGAIGAIIGHEIGHGFDDQGSQFDGEGRLVDWWTTEDRKAFEQLTRALVEQYNVLAPRQTPDNCVNGELTLGENIGDLGGLGIAWRAYQISLAGKASPVIDGMTGAQRFFLSWAQSWQQKSRDEEVVRLLALDPHSPNEFRCNQIVRNLDAFYDAFQVSEADQLWLDPADRVTVW